MPRKVNIFQRALAEFHYIGQKTWSYQAVGDFWDRVTDCDEINKETYSYFRRFIDGFQLCSIPENSYVLDICSRTGNGTVYFWQKGKIRQSVCADVSQKMLEICRTNLQGYQFGFKTVLFQNLPLPLPDKEFEAVLCFETLEHMPEPGKFIRELARVLKPGGELLLTTPNILWEGIHWLAAIFNLHHSEGPHRFLPRQSILKMAFQAKLSIKKEKTTVLVPFGPKPILKLGELLEKKLPEFIKRLIALRRIFIFHRLP